MELFEPRLSHRTVNGVCELIQKMQEVDPNSASKYISVIKNNNINGKVLLHCDMDELKKVLEHSLIFFIINLFFVAPKIKHYISL